MEKRRLRSEIGEDYCLEKQGALSLLRACGYSYEDLKKPRVAIINTWSEMNPGHIHLRDVAAEVKKGIYAAGGMGYEFNCVSVCDCIADSRYVLPSRDLLVNEIELLVEGNKMDAMVLIGTCDKIIPGLLMAAGRLNLPAIIVTGGYMQTGSIKGNDCDFIDIGMTISKFNEGTVTEEELEEVVEHACPGPGACGMMGTANTMNILAETIGMSFPGNSTTAAISPKLKQIAYDAGVQVMKLWEQEITARDIITNESITNAIKVCMAVGGSSNTIAHIPAIATEAELSIECSPVYAQASNEIPLLVGVRPNMPMHNMTQFDNAGGLGAVLNELKNKLDLDTMSVTGKTLGENMSLNPDMYKIKDYKVIHPISDPIGDGGGLVLCKGNLVPEGAFIKRSAVPKSMIKFNGPAKVFNDSHIAIKALNNEEISEGDVVIIRYHGVKAGPNTAYAFASALKGSHLKDKVAVITDGRMSGAAAGACFQYASPEAALRGPLCAVKDGDIISFDIDKCELNIELSDEELKERIESAEIILYPKKGYLGIYQKCVGSILKGAVLRG
ncbi:dihydroxy-acid dehydratase [Paratissierella segnis]|jgi:dihydroxy-acid dehydratase|uniref:Dihydroxy-acid dehydratase n=1 Tax=Paratissierella segnis TaxID=2763679 RepID=A0A926EUS2_9FIRM|nr:dihydroxy-acid dehydratase [Paratissierella segnis]MBC8589286.1 dihydroxy-acid dehydratase [Paratissierella segnis]